MCPFMLLTFFFTILMLMLEMAAAFISITFDPNSIQLKEGQRHSVKFNLTSQNQTELYGDYRFELDRPDVAQIESKYDFQINESTTKLKQDDQNFYYYYNDQIDIKANFLGYSRIELLKKKKSEEGNIFETIKNNDNYQLIISVIRDKDLISKIFIYSVVIVVSISYINMGCALDMDAVYQVLRRPVAPLIGLFSQYFCMPLISYGLAKVFFDETYLKLGIFIFGCSPGGGASNMWTVLINGNLNLSITMTFLSTLLSLGFMPFWLYTLGKSIYEETTTSPPSRNVFTTLVSMIIFLGIGLLIKRFFPKIANWARKILAPFSALMILFIIVFGTYSNFYMFRVMTWQMLIAAALNVWCGMFIGFVLAYVFGKSLEDMLTIAIETGVQNTGVTIVVLGLSLHQPDADLASAVPVAASIMTPIPLTIAWLVIKFRKRLFFKAKQHSNGIDNNSDGYDTKLKKKSAGGIINTTNNSSNSNDYHHHNGHNNYDYHKPPTSATTMIDSDFDDPIDQIVMNNNNSINNNNRMVGSSSTTTTGTDDTTTTTTTNNTASQYSSKANLNRI